MKYYLYSLIFLFSTEVIAQEFTISATVIEENTKPIAYANVAIFSSDKSEVIDGSNTDEDGNFIIENLSAGEYVLNISFVGYTSYSKTITLSKTINLGKITLKESTETLEGVTIITKKPTIKKLADRLVFNVENTALTQGNLLDVLRSTPTVFVSEETIKIKRNIPAVYINGRKVNLSGAEVIQLLENTPANSIKSVEAITTPGAKYEASSGTVLNIIMGKNLITGYRGRVFSNYKQGVFPNYNAGISNFYKTKKISLSANYSFSKNKENRDNEDEISFLDNSNTLNQLWASNINRNTWSETHNTSISLDYFINNNNTFTLSSNILLTPYFKYSTKNKTTVFDEDKVLLSSFNANTLSRDDKHNLSFDADYVSKFKNDGKLSLNAHYTTFDYSREQDVNSQYFLVDNSSDFDTAFRTNSGQNIEILTSQVDYYIPYSDDSSLSFGFKSSIVETSNDLTQADIIGGQQVLNNSNVFNYNENVLAAYASYEDKFGDFNFTAGLRVEQTDLEGESLNDVNKQNYLEWFPTIVLNHKTTETINIYTKYKRTISRPSYQSLNPFEFFLNDNIIVVGNPNLQPSFSNRWDLGVVFNDRHTFEVALTTIKGNVNELPIQDNINNIITYTPKNIGETTDITLAYETYFTLFKKASIYFTNAVYNITEKTEIENKSIELDQWTVYSDLGVSVNFLKDNSLSTYLSLTYISKSLQALQTVKGQLVSDLTISKTVFNKRGALFLNVSDIFNKSDFYTNTNYLNQRNRKFTNVDTRYIKLGFSYKFGNSTLETNEKYIDHKERDRIKAMEQ